MVVGIFSSSTLIDRLGIEPLISSTTNKFIFYDKPFRRDFIVVLADASKVDTA